MEQAQGNFSDPIYLKTQSLVDHVLFYSHVAPESHEIQSGRQNNLSIMSSRAKEALKNLVRGT